MSWGTTSLLCIFAQERLRAVVKEVSESRRRVILVVDEALTYWLCGEVMNWYELVTLVTCWELSSPIPHLTASPCTTCFSGSSGRIRIGRAVAHIMFQTSCFALFCYIGLNIWDHMTTDIEVRKYKKSTRYQKMIPVTIRNSKLHSLRSSCNFSLPPAYSCISLACWGQWLLATRQMADLTGRSTTNWSKGLTFWPMTHLRRSPNLWNVCGMWISLLHAPLGLLVSPVVVQNYGVVIYVIHRAMKCKMFTSQILTIGFYRSWSHRKVETFAPTS